MDEWEGATHHAVDTGGLSITIPADPSGQGTTVIDYLIGSAAGGNAGTLFLTVSMGTSLFTQAAKLRPRQAIPATSGGNLFVPFHTGLPCVDIDGNPWAFVAVSINAPANTTAIFSGVGWHYRRSDVTSGTSDVGSIPSSAALPLPQTLYVTGGRTSTLQDLGGSGNVFETVNTVAGTHDASTATRDQLDVQGDGVTAIGDGTLRVEYQVTAPSGSGPFNTVRVHYQNRTLGSGGTWAATLQPSVNGTAMDQPITPGASMYATVDLPVDENGLQWTAAKIAASTFGFWITATVQDTTHVRTVTVPEFWIEVL